MAVCAVSGLPSLPLQSDTTESTLPSRRLFPFPLVLPCLKVLCVVYNCVLHMLMQAGMLVLSFMKLAGQAAVLKGGSEHDIFDLDVAKLRLNRVHQRPQRRIWSSLS